MGCTTCRIIILAALLCLGILWVRSEEDMNVTALTSVDLALRRGKGRLLLSSFRAVEADDAWQEMSALAPSPAAAFDPNESQKRRVHRGADPIHNKC